MSNNEKQKAEIIEFVYDLLPEDRAAELRLRIANETEIAALYEQIRQTALIIANASRLETDSSVINTVIETICENSLNNQNTKDKENLQIIPVLTNSIPGTTQIAHFSHSETNSPQNLSRSFFSPHAVWEYAKNAIYHERGINRAMSYAAVTLVIITICGFLFQRYQMSRIARLPLRIVAIAPEFLVKNSPQTLQIQVTDLLGEQRQTPISVTLNDSHGQTFLKLKEQTDEHGELSLPLSKFTERLPSEMQDQSLQLEIFAENFSTKQNGKLVATLKLVENPQKTTLDYRAEVAAVHQKPKLSGITDHVARPLDRIDANTSNSSEKLLQNTATQQLPLPHNQMTSNSSGLYWSQNNQNPAQVFNLDLENKPQNPPIPLESSSELLSNFQRGETSREARTFSFRTIPESLGASSLTADSKQFGYESGVLGLEDSKEKPHGEKQKVFSSDGNERFSENGNSEINRRSSGDIITNDMSESTDSSFRSLGKAEISSKNTALGGRNNRISNMPESGIVDSSVMNGSRIFDTPQSLPKITFFAESGRLAASLENRVFFHVAADNSPMADFHGTIIDNDNQTVAEIKSNAYGFGEFYFVPEMNRRYQLAAENNSIDLDLPITEVPVTMSVTEHVVRAGEPITVLLRSRESGLPLVVSLSQNGVLIISESATSHDGVTTVTFSLPENTTGLITITVFEAKNTDLSILATENILSCPQKFLALNILPQDEKQSKKSTYSFDLQINTPNGEPISNAKVTVRAIRYKRDFLPQQFSERFVDSLFAEIPTETIRQLTGQLSQNNRLISWNDTEQWLAAIDKISQENLNFFTASYLQSVNSAARLSAKPVVIDNLVSLQAEYDQQMKKIYQNQKNSGRILGIIVIFGGMSLAVFSMILAVMRLVSGMRMFAMVIVSGIACVLVCTATMREQTDTAMQSEKSSPSFRRLPNAKPVADSLSESASSQTTDKGDIFTDFLKKNGASAKTSEHREGLVLQQPQTLPALELFYENVDLKSDANGCVHFDVPTTENSRVPFYLMIDAVSPDGLTGWKRWKQLVP
ncbi:MAG: hypothetical protein LBT05_08290 [Planctomycetaceae bacterium]|jgi:hypothetical protein|nr:hypothetical protein [Planctomycetaceae bacterium]